MGSKEELEVGMAKLVRGVGPSEGRAGVTAARVVARCRGSGEGCRGLTGINHVTSTDAV